MSKDEMKEAIIEQLEELKEEQLSDLLNLINGMASRN